MRYPSEAVTGAASAAFNKHLDGCAQCRDNPFAPCVEGVALLRAAAIEVGGAVLDEFEPANQPGRE